MQKTHHQTWVQAQFDFNPHSSGMRLVIEGFSRGLKTCHRHVFLTAFRIPTSINAKFHPQGVDFCFGGELGIRYISAARKSMSCHHQAGGKQQSTGLLHLIIRIPMPIKKVPPHFGVELFWRRVRDSNPRFLSESLVFKTSSLNRSDNSPCVLNYTILK